MIVSEKKCSKCGEVKALDCYWLRKGMLDGRRGVCVDCYRQISRDAYKKNPLAAQAKSKKWSHTNQELVNQRARDYRAINKSVVNKSSAKWKQNNPDAVKRQRHFVRATIRPSYARKVLLLQGFDTEQINPELIELKTQRITLLRLARELKQVTKPKATK